MRKIIQYEKQKLIYIRWEDAHSNSGWLTPEELSKQINHEKCMCEEVGWVVFENENELHMVSRRCEWAKDKELSFGLYQRIPKSWIHKRKIILK